MIFKYAKEIYLLQPVAEPREREGECEVGGEQVPAGVNVNQPKHMLELCKPFLPYCITCY